MTLTPYPHNNCLVREIACEQCAMPMGARPGAGGNPGCPERRVGAEGVDVEEAVEVGGARDLGAPMDRKPCRPPQASVLPWPLSWRQWIMR